MQCFSIQIIDNPNASLKTSKAIWRFCKERLQHRFYFICITAKPAPRKRFGHRRVGSHGNPPIKIDPQYSQPAAGQPQSCHFGGSGGMAPYVMSQSHPGEHSNRIAGELFTHPNLNHSRSWTPPENSMMAAAYRQQRTSGIRRVGKLL